MPPNVASRLLFSAPKWQCGQEEEHDFDNAQALIALVVVGAFLGWFETVRDFVADRLPLFIALGLAVIALVVLLLRRRIADSRQRAARQRVLDAQVASTDGMTGPEMATGVNGADVVVQCKRYAQQRNVSSPDMQKFPSLGTSAPPQTERHGTGTATVRP